MRRAVIHNEYDSDLWTCIGVTISYLVSFCSWQYQANFDAHSANSKMCAYQIHHFRFCNLPFKFHFFPSISHNFWTLSFLYRQSQLGKKTNYLYLAKKNYPAKFVNFFKKQILTWLWHLPLPPPLCPRPTLWSPGW